MNLSTENNENLVSDLKFAFDKNKDRYNIFLPKSQKNELINEYLKTNFPIASWGRIDWDKVKNHTIYNTNNHEQNIQSIIKICKKYNLKGDVFILWCDALKPCFRLNLETALKYVSEIISEDWDTWFINFDNQWCIEVYHEGEVCFGFSRMLAAEKE